MAAGQRRGFISGGTWCVDRNCVVSFWPGEDSIAEYLGDESEGGGSGYNLAVNMRRIDPTMPVEAITLIGDDDTGRLLLQLAAQHGIDRRQIHVAANESTQFTDAFISKASGHRTHIFRRGVASKLCPDHFDFSESNARYLHLGLPGIHDLLDNAWGEDANGWVTVLRKARAQGLNTNMELPSVDPAILSAIVRPCLPHLNLIIINDMEVGALAGMMTKPGGQTDAQACERAARNVLERGVEDMVVVHWPECAVAVPRNSAAVFKASVTIPQGQVTSANGAGDGFASGMLYGLHEGWPLEQCLRLAHANAACSLRALSTTGAIEPWRKSLELADDWGWRT